LQTFTKKAVQIIKTIPSGKVMTYGQIAKLVGSPSGARQVVRILHSMSKKHKLPWHRVINSKGEIGLKDDEHFSAQKFLLESEGVEFKLNRTLDLTRYLHHPEMEYGEQ